MFDASEISGTCLILYAILNAPRGSGVVLRDTQGITDDVQPYVGYDQQVEPTPT